LSRKIKKYKVETSISYPTDGAMGKTGSWRTMKPVFHKDKCVKCLRCWIFCPEGAVKKNKDGTVTIDMDYCKGCGICANVCKVKALKMEREEKK